jgi:FG-GAP-like repeat
MSRIRRPNCRQATLVILLLLCSSLAWAYVNPNFTPKHVESQSSTIFTFQVASIAADGKSAKLKMLKKIKGKPPKTVVLSFATALARKDGKKDVAEVIALLKNSGKKPALLSMGEFQGKEGGLMHLEATWVRLTKSKAGAWQFDRVDSELAGTFNGGTDMLIETMRFIRKFPDTPIMPVSGGIKWSEHIKLGKLPGKAALIQAVDVNADGKIDVFVGGTKGDRLFLGKGECAFEKPRELPSASLAAAWADFDGDGRVDLATLNAGGLNILFQKTAGKFTAVEIKLPGKVSSDSPTLHTIDLAVDGKADLVVGAGSYPTVLRNTDGKGTMTVVKLPAHGKDLATGGSGPCAVADFNADGFADILQICQKTAFFYAGKGDGSFAVTVSPGARMGPAKSRKACVADLDGDGRLDVWLVGGGRNPNLLQNRGRGRFEEVMRFTGEPHYNIKAGAVCGALGDYNNDTFVDMIAAYGEARTQTFFNRGFRSFAIDEALGLTDEGIKNSAKGQTAVLWADVDTSGSLELVIALADGNAYVSLTSVGEMEDPTCLMVSISPKSRLAADLPVRFYLDGRCLGTRVAGRWTGPALLGVSEPGEYEIRYRLPDGKEYSRTLEAEEGARRFAIGIKDKLYRPAKKK